MQRGRRNTEHDTIKEWVGETLIVQSWSSSSSLQSPLPSFFDLNANPRKCSTNLSLEALRSSPYSLSVRTSSALQNGLLFIGECMKNRVTNSASSAAPGSDRTAQGRHSGARTRQLILEGFCLSLGGDTSGAAATLWSLLGAGATIWRVLAQTFWMVFCSWRFLATCVASWRKCSGRLLFLVAGAPPWRFLAPTPLYFFLLCVPCFFCQSLISVLPL